MGSAIVNRTARTRRIAIFGKLGMAMQRNRVYGVERGIFLAIYCG
jgi:hypothetical protein